MTMDIQNFDRVSRLVHDLRLLEPFADNLEKSGDGPDDYKKLVLLLVRGEDYREDSSDTVVMEGDILKKVLEFAVHQIKLELYSLSIYGMEKPLVEKEGVDNG